jgi:hypothetical protein
MAFNHNSGRDELTHPFLFEIDNYISHLEAKPQSNSYSFARKSRSKHEWEAKARPKPHFNEDDYEEYDVQELLKENLKLQKRVKGYEEKVEDMEDELSTFQM